MNMVLPSVQKFGNKIECVAIVSGVLSMRMTENDCSESRCEIDCYYETADGERIHTVIICPLSELITVTELYELVVQKPQGTMATVHELPHHGS